MTLRPITFAMALMLSACAAGTVPWQNPALPEEQWGRDLNACRRWAESEIGYRDNDASVFRDYDRARAKKQADALAGACMRDKGYFPAKNK